ncbi:unnamed protein product [Clonostachys rosea f. rosea IK726]|uniref:Uncharacterized protein n=1 Tax=Clonostachys rosea f. rosea IK726 TaxID=1349383 RepID=A0ACA9TVX6_BIOOC|nr:unnamed protein product [Clonostachys rosea f. rosea IK726]
MTLRPFNLLTSTAGDIQKLFQLSDFNSTALVELLLQQIENHNQNGLHLGALISVAPRQQVLARARKLDEERIAGQSRSSLHGIPFIVKDSIATHPDMGMDTTGGSWALAGSRPSMSSPVVERRSTYHGMMQKLCSLGVHVEYPVELPTGDKVWSGIGDIINYEFSGVMDRYLGSLDASNVRSLEDLVEWNHRQLE